MGMLEGGLTWDYAQLVMQNEMVRMVLKCVKGISINDDKIAHDLLAEIGPGGEYISHKHTFQHFKELSTTELLDRKKREAWRAAGSKDLTEKAYEKAREILETYKPEPLPENIQKELKRILAEAEEETKEIKEKERRDSKK